jgi:uncharacterized protein YvpB
MVKREAVKINTPRRRTTNSSARSSSPVVKKSPTKTPKVSKVSETVKTPITTHRYDEKKPKENGKSRYQHYSTYQPSKESNFAISRHQAKTAKPSQPVKRRTRAEIVRRRQIVTTVIICLLVIFGVIVAKIFVPEEADKPALVGEVNQAKDVETPPKTEIELKKEKAEQNLSTIGAIFGDSSFSADSVVKLKVPIYAQTYKQSCEAASLRMALKYRGIETTDLDILKLMNYDDQPAKKVDGEWTWGDPHQTFVGNKDGDQTKMTGYGVFAEPIAAASEKLGRPAVAQNDVTPAWLAQQIYAGNPVVLWGASIKIADAHWTTPAGDKITVPMRTHTRLVIGVKGNPTNPTGFYINDPAGKEIYWTTAQLTANIALGIGQGVAIY